MIVGPLGSEMPSGKTVTLRAIAFCRVQRTHILYNLNDFVRLLTLERSLQGIKVLVAGRLACVYDVSLLFFVGDIATGRRADRKSLSRLFSSVSVRIPTPDSAQKCDLFLCLVLKYTGLSIRFASETFSSGTSILQCCCPTFFTLYITGQSG